MRSAGRSDLIDWPVGERDGFVLTGINSVVNAFYYHILLQMADIAGALGKATEVTRYQGMAAQVMSAYNATFFNPTTGLYVDGAGGTHSSLHANMFPLAFGLVPAVHKAAVVNFVKSRGMACSVYGAQYLLEALCQAGEPDAAVALMTATTDRSWTNMIRVGSTMTTEAWDLKYKPNLDWNHAWGAAPANIVARYLIGVQPAAPGFAVAAIRPQLGATRQAEAVIPTIRGAIHVALTGGTGQPYTMNFAIPASMTANVAVPAPAGLPCHPVLDGVAAPALTSRGGAFWIDGIGSGSHVLSCL